MSASSEIEATARWFLSRSDVTAAMKLLGLHSPDNSLLGYIKSYWPGYFNRDDYKQVYSEAGKIESKATHIFDLIPGSYRCRFILDFLRQLGCFQGKFLDFGCSRGFYSMHLYKGMKALAKEGNLPFDQQWTGIDIDGVSIMEARAQCRRSIENPRDFDFSVAGSASELKAGKYDVALCLEVLEHVTDPLPLVRDLEKSIKPGGWLILSVPSGPVEYEMWQTAPHRNREHLSEFTLLDLEEMFGNKHSFRFHSASCGRIETLGVSIGQTFIGFQVTDIESKEINWDRKLSLRGVPEVALPGLDS